jgi:uncharacterized protein DUF5694
VRLLPRKQRQVRHQDDRREEGARQDVEVGSPAPLSPSREARYGEPGDYAGPDLLAEWYKRNLRIYNNVTKVVAGPEDRVLVIFGAGHLGWLRQDFGADPTLRVRKLEDFVPASTAGAERH